MRTPFAALPQFPAITNSGAKTYAPSKVWKGSTTAAPRGVPINRKFKNRMYHEARRLDRLSISSRRGAWSKVKTQGALGRLALQLYQSLLFDFHDAETGLCNPSQASLAAMVGCCVRSVARALARLKAAGLVDWLNHCRADYDESGRVQWSQETNSYGMAPPGQWRGYVPRPDTPAPDPEAWGKAPTVGALGLAAGDGAGRISVVLQGAAAGGDTLAAALAGLSRRR